MTGNPGFSRLPACLGRKTVHRMHPPTAAVKLACGFGVLNKSGYEMTGSPGFSRLHACRDSGILSGTPDPAEAGTPIQ
jgi:hypothetical protein